MRRLPPSSQKAYREAKSPPPARCTATRPPRPGAVPTLGDPPGAVPDPVGILAVPPAPYGTAFSGGGVSLSKARDLCEGGKVGFSFSNFGSLVASAFGSGAFGLGSSL